MKDEEIVQLYLMRSEQAIHVTAKQYGSYLHAIAQRILYNRLDAEEVVNDTYHGAWNAIPPKRPDSLRLFLCRITRNLSLDRLAYLLAKKRNADLEVLLEEVEDCIPTQMDVEQAVEEKQFAAVLNQFLSTLDSQSRMIFLERYWYIYSVREIAAHWNCSESKVKSNLFRTRKKLKLYLEQEGLAP